MPPTLGDVFESRVRVYHDVVVRRDDVLRRWPERDTGLVTGFPEPEVAPPANFGRWAPADAGEVPPRAQAA